MHYTSDEQKMIYDDLVNHFKNFKEVKAIIQRGSLAKGEEDRASDLDILFILKDESITDFTFNLKEYLSQCCELLVKEPWYDSIVPDFGGFGLIYFIKKYNKLIQLDVYICPESNSKKILEFADKKIVYSTENLVPLDIHFDFSSTVNKLNEGNDIKFQLIFEFYLMAEMYAKHIYRANYTLALKYRYSTIEALAKLIRLVYKPEKLDYKMYDWSKDFSSLNAPIIRKFERNIVLIDIFSDSQLYTLIDIADNLFNETSLRDYYLANFKVLDMEVKNYITNLLSPTYI